VIKKLAIVAGLGCIAWQARGATGTYTLRLHETAAGQPTATNQFTVYATVEQGTNDGLFAFGVDLEGTFTALTNKTPSGFFSIDESSPNWDSTVAYPPAQYIGWGAGRGATLSTGVVSGVPDLGRDPLIRIYKFGQQAGAVTTSRPQDFVNPPDAGEHPNEPVPWKYSNEPGADLTWGTPPNPAGSCSGSPLPAGTVRLATGTWTGAPPTIGVGVNFPNTKASLWRLNHPNGTENDVANVLVQTRDLSIVTSALDSVSLSNQAGTGCSGPLPNIAVGGAISVTGANGKYVSEVDALISDSNAGSAPIATIGDEAGSIYVMAKLNGTPADIAAFLGATTADVQEFDPQFALLHGAYDSLFGAGGFNALFKFNNISGAKVFSIDASGASHGPITIDALAAVPEPGTIGILSAGAAALVLRKRKLRRVEL